MRRAFRMIRLVAGVALVSCSTAPGLESGSAIPSGLVDLGVVDRAPDPATTYVIWVVDAEACLSCQTPDYALRRLMGRDSTQLRVLHVGDARDEALVKSFLRERRLPMPAASISASVAHRVFGARNRPFLFVVRADTVRWVGAANHLNLDRMAPAESTRLGK